MYADFDHFLHSLVDDIKCIFTFESPQLHSILVLPQALAFLRDISFKKGPGEGGL
jgi:hypothetical protein